MTIPKRILIEGKGRVAALLRGIVLGDSLGLTAEGLTRRQVAKFHRGPIRQHFFLGKGFVSDDTEHALVALFAAIQPYVSRTTVDQGFHDHLVRWFYSASPGMGVTTLRSCLRLVFTKPPSQHDRYSIGYRSAGNGPLIRAIVIGAIEPFDYLHQTFRSTGLTHTDPRAYLASAMIAAASSFVVRHPKERLFAWEAFKEALLDAVHNARSMLDETPEDGMATEELISGLEVIDRHVRSEIDVDEALELLGCKDGIGAYIVHSVLASLLLFWRYRADMNAAIDAAIMAGGDTDSTAAIVGGLTSVLAERPDYSRLNVWSSLPAGMLDEKQVLDYRSVEPVALWKMQLQHAIMIPLFIPHFVARLSARIRARLSC